MSRKGQGFAIAHVSIRLSGYMHSCDFAQHALCPALLDGMCANACALSHMLLPSYIDSPMNCLRYAAMAQLCLQRLVCFYVCCSKCCDILCRSAKVTVADQVKVVIVSTDRNAREDQILVFVVSHKDDVGMVELEVCDLLLGDLQVCSSAYASQILSYLKCITFCDSVLLCPDMYITQFTVLLRKGTVCAP